MYIYMFLYPYYVYVCFYMFSIHLPPDVQFVFHRRTQMVNGLVLQVLLERLEDELVECKLCHSLPWFFYIFFSSNMEGFEEIPRFFLKSEVGFFCSWLVWAIQSHSLSRKRLGLKWLVRKVELGCRSSLVIWSVVKKKNVTLPLWKCR